MSTCGSCRYFAVPIEETGTCFAVASPRPLFEDIRSTDAACASFKPCELIQARVAQAAQMKAPAVYVDPMDILSQETKDKLRTTRRGWEG